MAEKTKQGKVISVIGFKGGTGKSSISKMLASALTARGKSILIVDTCQNGSIATGFLRDRDSFEYTLYDFLIGNAKPSEVIESYKDEIYYIPSNERIEDYPKWVNDHLPANARSNHFKTKIDMFKQLFDYIIIDTHPNEASEVVNYVICATEGGIVLIPSDVDIDGILGMERSLEVLKSYQEYGLHADYGLIFNKIEHIGKSRTQLEQFKERLRSKGVPEDHFFGEIRHSQKISTTKNDGLLITDLVNDKYAKNIINDIDSIADRVLEVMEG